MPFPQTFLVACLVTTQIIDSIASSQYGGISINVSHLAKYIRKSKEKLYNEKSILCILEHYRTLFKNKITSSEILTILSIILPIPLSFIKDGEFDIKGLVTVIPYLICFANQA